MCWGVCATTEWKNFIPCTSCKRKRKERIEAYYGSAENSIQTHNTTCGRCRDLELVGNGVMFGTQANKSYPKRSYSTQISYPQKRHPPNIAVLLPFYYTFNNLKVAAKAAVINYTSGTWVKTTFRVFLQSCGFNKNCVKELEASVAEMKNRNYPPEDITFDSLTSIPSLWKKSYPMSLFVYSRMHLLFLGLTKSVIALMRKFATYLKVCTPFVRRVNPYNRLEMRLL